MASIKKTMAFDSAPPDETDDPSTPGTDDGSMPEGDAPESAPESAPGEASIPLAAFGEAQPKAGDTLQVVAVDEENGTVSVKLAGGGKPGGIDAQAAMMDENAV